MKLYLVRHAKAASIDIDQARPLTDEGRRDMQKVAVFLKPLEINVNYLWHSGKKRAEQTAEILADVVNVKNQMTTHEGLAPNDDVTIIKDEVITVQSDIMIVAHLPFVSRLASLLLTGDKSKYIVTFRPGGVISLESIYQNHWQINWMITPELIV
jgi:phosphohistidine phosphatase